MSYPVRPFRIIIGQRLVSGAYAVRATTDQVDIHTELVLPPYAWELSEALCRVPVLPLMVPPQALGRALGRALLTGPLRSGLVQAAQQAIQAHERVQIQLQINAPGLAALPWEWLTLGSERSWSPALRFDSGLVRISPQVSAAPSRIVNGPLRILAVASATETAQLAALEEALAFGVQTGRLVLRLCNDNSPEALALALAHECPHILHCAAPVTLTPQGSPRLAIGAGIDAFDLAEYASSAPDMRLVLLAGAQGDAKSASLAAPLLATTLISSRIPATIAVGAALPATLMASFAARCYYEFAMGHPLDMAVTAGRQTLAQHDDGWGWGAPQLRLASGGERAFVMHQTHRRIRLQRMLVPAAIPLLIALFLVGRAIGGGSMAATATPLASPVATMVSRPQALPTAPRATTTPAIDTRAPSSYTPLIVAPGDTLEQLAERMGSDVAAISALNHLDPHDTLRSERPLVIPVFRPGTPAANGLIIARGNPNESKVALTFDIEIDDTTLYAILDTLHARSLHGTFFVTGNWVRRYPDAARAIVAQGHEIGNHSLTHPYFSRIGLDGAVSELEKTEQIVIETTGASTRPYFRFPYGDSTAETLAIVARAGYVAYHWSADDPAIPGWLTWAAQHPDQARGSILLMHGRASTATALANWLDTLATLGLQPTTLGDVLR